VCRTSAAPASALLTRFMCRPSCTATGWVQQYVGNALRVALCAINVQSLPPSMAGLTNPPATALWQVIFGDAATGTATACGWFAQHGNNLTYRHNWTSASSCPRDLIGADALPNYFSPSATSGVADVWRASVTFTGLCAVIAAVSLLFAL
jgi:hypothetical protein